MATAGSSASQIDLCPEPYLWGMKSFLLRDTDASRGPTQLHRLQDLLGEWRRTAEDAYRAKQTGQLRGPMTGLKQLDNKIGGCMAPGLHVVHAQPGARKTALAWQVASQCGFPAVFVTAEMQPIELLRRLTARVTDTFMGKFRSGELEPDEAVARAEKAIQENPGLYILDARRHSADQEQLRKALMAARGDEEHVLLVIDSLHSWVGASLDAKSEYGALNAGIAVLQKVAAEMNCPIMVICERNRAAMEEGGMSGGAGTRRIEYSAETLMTLEPAGDEDQLGDRPVKVKIVKNRHGSPGATVDLKFRGSVQWFREV